MSFSPSVITRCGIKVVPTRLCPLLRTVNGATRLHLARSTSGTFARLFEHCKAPLGRRARIAGRQSGRFTCRMVSSPPTPDITFCHCSPRMTCLRKAAFVLACAAHSSGCSRLSASNRSWSSARYAHVLPRCLLPQRVQRSFMSFYACRRHANLLRYHYASSILFSVRVLLRPLSTLQGVFCPLFLGSLSTRQ